jgi:hypothetical protein
LPARRGGGPDEGSEETKVSSIHRTGLTIAGLATAVVVGGVFVAQGYVAAQDAAARATSQASAAATASATPTLGPETVYVNPVPSPAIIHVTQTAPPVRGNPPVIHIVVPTRGGDDGGNDD